VSENTREKLLDSGLRLLHERGFNGCGVQDITAEAGVPKGSFYHYFASKDAFALEVLERYWQGLRLSLKPLGDQSVAPVERLRRYFALMAQAFGRWKFEKGCMIGNFGAELSDQSPHVRNRLAAIMAEWSRAIASCVRDAQNAGELRPHLDAEEVGTFLANSFEGAILRAKMDKTANAFDAFSNVSFMAVFNVPGRSSQRQSRQEPRS
jgi:TetR/AcrR family transcriptional regulator, transcriptional repressor for nem operon